MRILYYFFLLLLLVLGIGFALLNAGPVSVNYYFGSRDMALSLVIVYSVLVGIILALFVILIPYIKIKAANYRLRKQLKHEKE